MYSRYAVVDLINSWMGLRVSDGSYKKILDLYNSQKVLPRGVKMKTGMSWCAATWSALAIKLGYEEIMPIECSCGQLINKAKEMGIWKENDNYVPLPGDAILYDWDDSGRRDCTGWPDHVGTVLSVNKNIGIMTVGEGNKNKAVGKRTIGVGARYIRGYITPKYDDQEEPTKKKDKTSKSGEVIKAAHMAMYKTNQLEGSYKTRSKRQLRNGAGAGKKAMVVVPSGTNVICYGYYNEASNGNIWPYVAVEVNGQKYEGFFPLNSLKKV